MSAEELPAPVWESSQKGHIEIGSGEHKELFCRMLLDTYDPYKPAIIEWPALEGSELARLTGLPFWDIAVETEGYAAMRMQSAADATEDSLIKEAISLKAFEERRHKEVLSNMIQFYGIDIGDEPEYPIPSDPIWAFIKTGYGECFDSFFAFGLFKLAKDSGFFPDDLVQVFEPVIQEEARHIIFFVNWISYMQARRLLVLRPSFSVRRLYSLMNRAWNRLKFARKRTNNSNLAEGVEELCCQRPTNVILFS